jgi:hypothetical protein
MHILLPERKRLTRLLTFECFVTLFGYVYVRPESVLTNDHRVSKHFCYKNVWRPKRAAFSFCARTGKLGSPRSTYLSQIFLTAVIISVKSSVVLRPSR